MGGPSPLLSSLLQYCTWQGLPTVHIGGGKANFFWSLCPLPTERRGPILNRLIRSGWALEIAQILDMPARAGKLFWSSLRRVNPAPDCFPYVGRRRAEEARSLNPSSRTHYT